MGLTWLALGDSITEAYSGGTTTPDKGYAPRTRERLKNYGKNCHFLNHGISGYRSDQVLTLFQKRLKRTNADVITILCGTNDVTQAITDTVFKTNLSALVDEVKKNKSDGQCVIVLCTIPMRNDASNSQVPTFNLRISEVATEKGVLLCDTYTAFSSTASLSDAVHPNDSGHDLISGILAPFINTLDVWNKTGKR